MVHRIAVIDKELCNPKKCPYICVNVCPINRMRKETVKKGKTVSPLLVKYFAQDVVFVLKDAPLKQYQ